VGFGLLAWQAASLGANWSWSIVIIMTIMVIMEVRRW